MVGVNGVEKDQTGMHGNHHPKIQTGTDVMWTQYGEVCKCTMYIDLYTTSQMI
jgi:hypothetical protein